MDVNEVKQITKLVNAYNSIEICYHDIEKSFGEIIDIDTLTSAQVDIINVICSIVENEDDTHFMKINEILDNNIDKKPDKTAMEIVSCFKNNVINNKEEV